MHCEKMTLIDPTEDELAWLDVQGSGQVLRDEQPIVLIAQDSQDCYWAVADQNGLVLVFDPYTAPVDIARYTELATANDGDILPDAYNQGFCVRFFRLTDRDQFIAAAE